MLSLDQFTRRTRQEAAMSTMFFPTAAGQDGRVVRRESNPTQPPTSKTRYPHPTPDEEMMYAWSIGVTESARSMRQPHHEEQECPPEVYIG